jgi:hypothetical protein
MDNQRIGTVDLILGVIAASTLELRKTGQEAPYLPVTTLSNRLRQMQEDPEYADALEYLDFDKIGDNWISKGLNDLLFQSGTWGLHRVPNPSLPTITLDQSRAESRIEKIEQQYGVDAKAKVQKMASIVVSGI